jgi:hypothetical protein
VGANVVTWYAQEYAKVINLLVQQRQSRLRKAVTEQRYEGVGGQPVDQIGLISMQPVTSRFQPMGRVDAPTNARWVYPGDYDLPQLLDSFDKLRLIVDPKGKMVEAAIAAAQRQIDDTIIAAFSATAKTGQTGTGSATNNTFVSVQQGATSPTGLTVAKLRQAKMLLMQQEAIDPGGDMDDGQEIYFIAGARQLDNLLAEAQVVSSDFNSTEEGRPILRDGKIERFLGVNFIRSERLLTGTDDQSGTSTQCFMWTKEGMHLGLWNDIATDIAQRKDLQGLPWQAYIYMTIGATRLEENRVQGVWCR